MSLVASSVWATVFLSVLVLVLGRIVYALHLSPYRHIPGPRVCKITQYWTLWHDIRLRRVDKIREWHRRYGDVVLIAPGEVSFSDAGSTREIYGSSGGLPKSRYFDNFVAYCHRSVFSTLGVKEHQEVLKRTIAFYRPTSVFKSALLQPVRDNVKKTLNQLARRTENDMLVVCNLFSFDNITSLLYGPDLCTRTIEHESCFERTMVAGWMTVELWNNLLYNFPLTHKVIKAVLSYCSDEPGFLAADDKLADWNMKRVDAALSKPENIAVNSLLYVLSTAKTSDGLPLPKSWIAAELLDNIHAAQSTVALALTYVLWDLANCPEWQRRIRVELSSLPLNDDGLPAVSNLQSAPILDACITESSRLHPLSSGRAERVVPANRAYNGIVLPANTVVSTSTLAIHHRPEVFPNPQAFKPERWLHAKGEVLHVMQSCYIPFGYGARLCLVRGLHGSSIRNDESDNGSVRHPKRFATRTAL
ncbi:cytochrome P450 family protein [Lophiotrema nucula]|uniref:Cytochrome P450 family protein n=1 Tax=Lophiotrema nucula TaxID=690887 RepID=A0A6A5YNA0_9PLEO|nr:cytochrome P450 family protein [Lophiotrema nucula]